MNNTNTINALTKFSSNILSLKQSDPVDIVYKGHNMQIRSETIINKIKYTILSIYKKNNDTPCVYLSYSETENILYLDNLLYMVEKTDKCRDSGTNGPFYISLIFIIVKAWILHLNLNVFTVTDNATIANTENIIDDTKPYDGDHENLNLTTIKLITEFRSFYEGYGFLPIIPGYSNYKSITGTYYKKLKFFIMTRHEILNTPLDLLKYNLYNNTYFADNEMLINHIASNIEFIFSKIDEILHLIRTMDLNEDQPNTLHYLYVKFSKLNHFHSEHEEQCIYNNACNIIKKNIYQIVCYGFNNFAPYNKSYNYYCNKQASHYEKVSRIYNINGIPRKEIYCMFLSRTSNTNNIKSMTKNHVAKKVSSKLIKNVVNTAMANLKSMTQKNSKVP